MENEVKVETKKKGNGLFTLFACIMTGIIVFLATNIGQKASKTVDPDTPKKNEVTSNVESNTTSNVESNVTSNATSNVVSNTTSNVPVATKLSDTEALAIGKDLYKKALENTINPLNAARYCTKLSGDSDVTYDCTNLYNNLKTIFVANHDVFKVVTVKDGKYLYTAGATGVVGTFTTTLSLVSVDTEKLVFTANTTIDYGAAGGNSSTSDAFEVVKENGTWKVSKFTYQPTTLK